MLREANLENVAHICSSGLHSSFIPGSLQMNAKLLNQYNLGLKLIEHFISFVYALLYTIHSIRFRLLQVQHVQSPLFSRLRLENNNNYSPP